VKSGPVVRASLGVIPVPLVHGPSAWCEPDHTPLPLAQQNSCAAGLARCALSARTTVWRSTGGTARSCMSGSPGSSGGRSIRAIRRRSYGENHRAEADRVGWHPGARCGSSGVGDTRVSIRHHAPGAFNRRRPDRYQDPSEHVERRPGPKCCRPTGRIQRLAFTPRRRHRRGALGRCGRLRWR